MASTSVMPLTARVGFWALALVVVGVGTLASVGTYFGALGIPWFPAGLGYLLKPASPDPAALPGWFLYIFLTIMLFRSERWSHYWGFYAVFAVILVLNAVGCHQMAQSVKLT